MGLYLKFINGREHWMVFNGKSSVSVSKELFMQLWAKRFELAKVA